MLSIYLSTYLYIYLSIYPSIYLSIHPSIYLLHHSSKSRRRVFRMVPEQPFFLAATGKSLPTRCLARMWHRAVRKDRHEHVQLTMDVKAPSCRQKRHTRKTSVLPRELRNLALRNCHKANLLEIELDNIKNACSFWTWQHPKRSNSARLLQFLNLTTSKTTQFCETTFKNGKLSAALTASYQWVLRFFHSTCLKYCACHEKLMPGHTKCCTCHAKSS